jgi:hypothetical protein
VFHTNTIQWDMSISCPFCTGTRLNLYGGAYLCRVEEFKYLGKTLMNKNSIQEEIKSILNSGNACYHSVQNLLSSSLLSKNCKD